MNKLIRFVYVLMKLVMESYYIITCYQDLQWKTEFMCSSFIDLIYRRTKAINKKTASYVLLRFSQESRPLHSSPEVFIHAVYLPEDGL